MYLRRIRLKNVRAISQLDWVVPSGKEAGWHVIIGDNGAGKSTVLRSVALALVGPKEAFALRQNWDDWLTRGTPAGYIRLSIRWNSKLDKFSGSGKTPFGRLLPLQINFTRLQGDVELKNATDGKRHVWGNKPGWFSASYGPFRRFAGGDTDADRIFLSNPKLASHLSVFGENVALTECLTWLKELKFRKLENDREGKLLDSVQAFINQEGFLPYRAQLKEVTSKGVEFVDANNCQLLVEDLSDGYRSVLSMTFELIRQLSRAYSPSAIFNNDKTKVIVPGVVLIDEVDAHLHPTWQRKIGLWLREHFPKMQFIVTTHSPLVCQAANVGTVWRLPRPGTKESGKMLEGLELERLLYGNVLDAYSTEAFGENVTRSEESKKKLQRLAELNLKELERKLTNNELEEQKQLRAILPTTAHITTENLSD
ncbi:MAG TPA: AAA family ATPase [Pyrinomonadaceae bacterium]|nr:AAA family ATPase [Pyrinomonadaceae bacterium]